MVQLRRLALLIAALAGALGTVPAAAQFGGIFRDGPPRPPADVPVYRDERLPPDVPRNYPGYDPRREAPQPPPPPLTRFPQGVPPSPGGVQTQPLPPPPGTAPPQQANVPPPQTGPGQAPLSGLPPGQRQPRGTPQPPTPPSDEVVMQPPSQKIVNPAAVFAGLDKITGRIISFDVAMDETVQFGALRLTPRACYTRPPTETPQTDGFIEVDEITLQGEVKRIFTGWMFASSPGLHGIEHPIYDVWLTDCKKEAPTAATAQASQQQPQAVSPPQPPPSAPAQPLPTPPGVQPAPPRR